MLEEEIEGRRLPEGHRLGTKDELRKRFGVAAATVNEALRILDMRGLVDARPGRGGGVFVTSPSLHPFRSALGIELDAEATVVEWREIRDALEPTVCRKAARRCGSRDARRLHRVVEEMREATADPVRFMALNWSLHRHIAELGDSPPLTRLYRQLLEILEAVAEAEVAVDPLYDPSVNLEIHEALVTAIVSGSPDELAAAIRRHTPASER
jgi:DNA-binding FadR family transcriptional regulator